MAASSADIIARSADRRVNFLRRNHVGNVEVGEKLLALSFQLAAKREEPAMHSAPLSISQSPSWGSW